MSTGIGSILSSLTSSANTTKDTNALASGQALTESDFLNMLITELENQDPTNPVDDTQMASQMAQFSSLAAMTNMSTTLQSMSNSESLYSGVAMIGKTIAATDPKTGAVTQGVVSQVHIDGTGNTTLLVGNSTVPLSNVTTVM